MPPTSRFPSPPFDFNPVPRPCVLLLLQTPLSYFQPRRPLLCQTELRPFSRWARERAHPYRVGPGDTPLRSTTPSPPSRQGTPGPSRSRHSTPGPSRSRHSTPGPSKPRSVRFPSQPPASDDEGSEREDTGEITELGAADADGLIPKPDGEVGRKKRGYSLKPILGWDDETFKAVKKTVNKDISNYLDHSQSASNQPVGVVKSLTKLIAAKHPIVSQFRDAWPIADMIHLRLKYTSSRRGAQRVPQGEDYPKSLKEAMIALEKGKAVERPSESDTTRKPRKILGAQAEQEEDSGPSPVLMGINKATKKRAGKKQDLEREMVEENVSSDSEEDQD